MSWRDISLTWLRYQTHDGATILSGVAFTRGPRPAESWSFALRRNGCFVPLCRDLHNGTYAENEIMQIAPVLGG
jgi:hypothetical protein